MTAQYMKDTAGDEGGMLNSGSVFGIVGDVAYEDGYQFSVGQGALGLGNSVNVTSSNVPFIEITDIGKNFSMSLSSNEDIKKIPSISNFNSKTNRVELATLIMSEASVGNYAEQVAVGNTVINRMHRNNTTKVGDVWNAYAHNQTPSQEIMELATALLSDHIADNTGGATHYYSPRSMPKKGAPTDGFDIGGGLERIAGRTTESYRPSFANSFKYVNIPEVREEYYKFYFAPGTGKVR